MNVNIASPCTGVCKMDDTSGWCLGCGRSRDEITDWRSNTDDWREAIWKQIPVRLGQLGVICRRLPWTTERIREFVFNTCKDKSGTWVMGTVGAVAEFAITPEGKTKVEIQEEYLIAETNNGALQMQINDDVRALTFDSPNPEVQQRIVLAVIRERGRLLVANGVTNLGEDKNALFIEPRTRLYDLGLGRKETRFCVRVADGDAKEALDDVSSLQFSEALPRFAASLVSESPTRIVETALGRIEVQGRIPPPGSRSPRGPHTHLLPDYLATARVLPVGMDIPRAYLPGAIFYPNV